MSGKRADRAGSPGPARAAGTHPAVDARRAADLLADRLGARPEVAVVLGSGLGGLVEALDDPVEVAFADVPGFPSAGVKGHAGRYVGGTLNGRTVLMQAGRFHVYEGHPMAVIAAPVRIAAALGVRTLVVTNAAGGAARHLGPGDVMLIDDHLNLMFRSPLLGPVREGEVRFPDMSAPYDSELQALALEVARLERTELARGTYAAVAGPSYETPAEVRMLRWMGADAIGMSTVPEVVTARAAGLRCLGFSLITNRAAGLSLEPVIGTAPTLPRPGQRLLSSMTPTILARDGELVAVIGSPGGRTIINTVLSLVLHLVDFEMGIQEAVDAPRLHHQWLPDELRIEEGGASDAALATLREMGHAVELRSRQGLAHSIGIDPVTGQRVGAPDRRSPSGTAAGSPGG